ncbi:MAG: thiol reductant ABC exporter subunit CydC [Firmicutes bacterium]|nr:thiol reductant ABC exporter subunit CydC [Alicyclobacillaceae bacterium]MCL6498258.1 thiol reductant ABC exporter subunit CydC [Bacillota bacterium]
MRRLWQIFAPSLGPLAGGSGLLALTWMAGLCLLATSAYLLSRAAFHPATLLLLYVPIAGVRFFSLAKAALRYAERLFSHNAILKVLSRLRGEVFRRAAAISGAALRASGSGDWVSRLMHDVERLQNFYLEGAGPLVAFIAAAGLAVLALTQVGAAVGRLAAGFAVAALLVPTVWVWRELWHPDAVAGAQGAWWTTLVQAMEGLSDIVVLGMEPKVRELLGGTLGRLGELEWRRDLARAHVQSVFLALGNLAAVAMVPLAATLVEHGALASVALATLVFVPLGFQEALGALTGAAPAWVESIRAASRIWPEDTSWNRPAGPTPPPTPGYVAKDLWVRLNPGGPDLLQGQSFYLAEGTHVLLTGPSGAGKSTLLGVLSGMVPFRGAVWLDGRDVRDWEPDQISARITWVGDDSHIFRATVAENLAVANPKATRRQMEEALAEVGLDGWLANLPQGLDTYLEGGEQVLSGGEAGRLKLARAFLRETPWLFLDEPLAGLDGANARKVVGALGRWTQDKGLVVVSHLPISQGPLRFDYHWHLAEGHLTSMTGGTA